MGVDHCLIKAVSKDVDISNSLLGLRFEMPAGGYQGTKCPKADTSGKSECGPSDIRTVFLFADDLKNESRHALRPRWGWKRLQFGL